MKLGFLTAPFPDLPLAEVADWAAANDFESLEDRLLAAHHRDQPSVCGHVPHRRSRSGRG